MEGQAFNRQVLSEAGTEIKKAMTLMFESLLELQQDNMTPL